MLAVHFSSSLAEVLETPQPSLRPGHALLRLRVAGICNTDIELLHGYYGFSGIPGHEFVADVVAAADSHWVGRRVVGEINLACGKCSFCKKDLGRHCANRDVLGIVRHPGAFAEYLTLPLENLLAVPKSIPDAHAVFTEPLAAALEILEQVKFPKKARVAVLGDGKLGLLIAQALQLSGLRVELFGRNENKLSIVQPLGVKTHLISRKSPELPSSEFGYAVDATGSAEGFAAALCLLRPRGTLVMKSTVHQKLNIDTAPLIVNEITMVGSRCGRFAPALKMLKRGELILDAMLHAAYPLNEAVAALSHAQQPGVLKVLLSA